MVLHYFNKKENKDKIIANKIYKEIIQNVKSTVNKKELLIKKNFNSSFEIIVIFLFIIFISYKTKKEDLEINQNIFEIFINDLDKSLREQGIGDVSIGKYVKSYVKKTYFRFKKLDIIIKDNNFNEFNKFIEKINIQNIENNNLILSEYFFSYIKKLLKKAKKEEISKFKFDKITN
tara:strand:+ start:941 stop:1468 length:528 start_codon:yes stop_codon:yes gene_type:complete